MTTIRPPFLDILDGILIKKYGLTKEEAEKLSESARGTGLYKMTPEGYRNYEESALFLAEKHRNQK